MSASARLLLLLLFSAVFVVMVFFMSFFFVVMVVVMIAILSSFRAIDSHILAAGVDTVHSTAMRMTVCEGLRQVLRTGMYTILCAIIHAIADVVC